MSVFWTSSSFSHSLVQWCVCWNVCHFFCVIFKNIRHNIYTCFSDAFCTFFPISHELFYFNRCALLFGSHRSGNLFRTQKCEKINIAEIHFFFRRILCLSNGWLARHGKTGESEQYIAMRSSQMHIKTHRNIEQTKRHVYVQINTRRHDFQLTWVCSVMFCARSQRLN